MTWQRKIMKGCFEPGFDHVDVTPTFPVRRALPVLEKGRETPFGPIAVKTQRPISSDDDHRVVKFRPRTSAQPPGRAPQNVTHQASDLSRYERKADEPDDFRHRMLANLAAFAFTVALTAIGIWLAMSIAELRKNQDCVLMGRRDCAQISSIPRG
jgi:hypothetical protein